MTIAADIFLIIGALFMFLGVLGLVRMPDVFNRIQVGTKATTLGFVSIVVGLFFLHPDWWSKLLVIGAFVLMTNPIGSHNLARAAHRRGERVVIEGVDRLREPESEMVASGAASSGNGSDERTKQEAE